MRGNITMLIWWGKNNPGQSDKLERTENIDITTRTEDGRFAALKAFENFRRDLAQAQPRQLPVPQPVQ